MSTDETRDDHSAQPEFASQQDASNTRRRIQRRILLTVRRSRLALQAEREWKRRLQGGRHVIEFFHQLVAPHDRVDFPPNAKRPSDESVRRVEGLLAGLTGDARFLEAPVEAGRSLWRRDDASLSQLAEHVPSALPSEVKRALEEAWRAEHRYRIDPADRSTRKSTRSGS